MSEPTADPRVETRYRTGGYVYGRAARFETEITVAHLNDWAERHQLDPEQVTLSRGVYAHWDDTETDAERDQRLERQRRSDERHEVWERKWWTALLAKYGPDGDPTLKIRPENWGQ